MRDAALRLEALQRPTVTDHYNRPVPLLTLLDGFEKFGVDQLAADLERPQVLKHRMNGRGIWFYWSAFCDGSLRLAPTQAAIPAEFWFVLSRFAVAGFPAGLASQPQTREFALQLAAGHLPSELARRYKESGL